AFGKHLYRGNDSLGQYTPIFEGSSEDAEWHFAAWQGSLYIANGVDTLRVSDGLSVVALGYNPKRNDGSDATPNYLTHYQSRLFVTGDPVHPNRVWASGVNNDNEWD